MRKVEDYEKIRRAFFNDHKSIRQIHRELGYSRETIRRAIAQSQPEPYTQKQPRAAPVLGPYKTRIDELLKESDQQRRKQRYTAHRIYELIHVEGYVGSEGSVHNYVCRQRQRRKVRDSFLPLEFDPGMDAQVDWGEAEVEIAGKREMVHLFVLHLNYSRVRFVMAFPFEKQEAFLEGHIRAFHFLGGVPHRITYDNLKTAVYQILAGHKREEQNTFLGFRSHYLFESFYCNVGQGHEKGGVENDMGYVQRNFMAPLLHVDSYAQLNAVLLERCRENTNRHIRGQAKTVADLWIEEKVEFLPLPDSDYRACTIHVVTPNGYSQVSFENNRYSVPVNCRNFSLVLEAYAFQVRILADRQIVAEHLRCFERGQDIIIPQHYLPLLEQRPGAFDHAMPMRRWRQSWPKEYEQLLSELRRREPEGQGVRQFIAVLRLHEQYPAQQVEQAVHQALELDMPHLNGVHACLERLLEAEHAPKPLDLHQHPQLQNVGHQPLNLSQYDQLAR